MRKFMKFTALALVFALMLTVCATAFAATAGSIKLSSGTVNLRKSASTSSSSLAKMSNGAKVEVLSSTGDWYKITYSGKTGYVQKQYVSTSTSSGSSSSSSSNTSGKTATVSASKATIYKTASTSSGAVTTASKGAKLSVMSETTSWYQVSYNGKTGWIPKKNVTVSSGSSSSGSSGSSSGSSSSSSGDATPGSTVGYKNSTISKPAEPVSTKNDLLNAINYNLIQGNEKFTVKVKNYSQSLLPTRTSELEYSYTQGNINPAPGTASGDVTPIEFTATFSPAGKVIHGKSVSGDTKASSLKTKVDSIIKSEIKSGMSDFEKADALHDYLMINTAYKDGAKTAYDALVSGKANCQGYAESMAVLLTAANLENRFVWAKSKVTGTGTHGFNKVKLEGKWYNIDATVDDISPDVKGRVKHDYLTVDDSVLRQRYSWEEARYPAATDTKNNWHYRNDLVATSSSELQTLVKAAVAKKETQISVWVEDFSTSKYSTSFAKSLPGVSSVKVTTTPAESSFKTYKTSIFFQVTYK